jgi:hypothetical protein
MDSPAGSHILHIDVVVIGFGSQFRRRLVYIVLVPSIWLAPETLSHTGAVSIYGRMLLVVGQRPHRDDQFGIGESCM